MCGNVIKKEYLKKFHWCDQGVTERHHRLAIVLVLHRERMEPFLHLLMLSWGRIVRDIEKN